MKVALEQPRAGGYYLRVSLINESSDDVKVLEHRLPWGNRTSLNLGAIRADPESTPLKPSAWFIDDPRFTVVKLSPNQTVTGQVDLSDYFADIPQAVRKSDVIVFWSYRLESEQGPKSNRVGGWVLIPGRPRE